MTKSACTKDVFNPYRKFLGSIIPEWLEVRTEISHGAKIIYARLSQFSGKTNICNPKIKTLASKTGNGIRQTKTYLKELRDNELISIVRRGRGFANLYIFHTHPWMNK